MPDPPDEAKQRDPTNEAQSLNDVMLHHPAPTEFLAKRNCAIECRKPHGRDDDVRDKETPSPYAIAHHPNAGDGVDWANAIPKKQNAAVGCGVERCFVRLVLGQTRR
jgi:hypothetical protein